MREGATAQPLATLTAIDILRSGGNAVDAAVAACAVQCVVEAGSTGIGGDCFALLSLGGTDKVLAYNGSGRAPAAATVEHLRSLGVTSLSRSSPHTITVPGAVDAWTRLVADHGRMKMADILAPAIKLARDSYVLPPPTAHDLAAQAEILKDDPAASRVFLVDGKAPPAGSIQHQKQLADTLEVIGREGRTLSIAARSREEPRPMPMRLEEGRGRGRRVTTMPARWRKNSQQPDRTTMRWTFRKRGGYKAPFGTRRRIFSPVACCSRCPPWQSTHHRAMRARADLRPFVRPASGCCVLPVSGAIRSWRSR
ncbi:gamma-glutamyltransferase [Neorhizobium tunisiense]|uniref:gamma-glutamyltransferase n=1 Tax=Neorhizobium tunisiense TaxID=3144793 RepID=UPI0040483812